MEPNFKNGTRYRKILSFAGKKFQIVGVSEKEMMKKYYAKLAELEEGDIIINKNTTVARWCEEWLKIHKKPAVQKSTYKNIKILVEKHIVPDIKHLKISAISRQMLQKILNAQEGGSFSQVSKIKMYMQSIFDCAEKDGLIKQSPARFLELPNNTKADPRVLTDEEYDAALELCKAHRAGLFVMVMLRCGLRRGEAIPLTWPDIDFDKKILTVNKSVMYAGNQPEIKHSAKTKAGMRMVGIPDDLLFLLAKKKKASPHALLFYGEKTKSLLTITQINRMWSSFKRDLDIRLGAELYRNKIIVSKIAPGFKIHTLRHTCITRLVLAGADIKNVQVFAGHSDITTTMNIYTHVSNEQAISGLISFQNSVPQGVPSEKEPTL